MKITKTHLRFWRERKVPAPGWVGRINPRDRPVSVSVHQLINAQAKDPLNDCAMQVQNTLVLIRLAMKVRGLTAVQALESLSLGRRDGRSPHGVNADRWLRKIKKD